MEKRTEKILVKGQNSVSTDIFWTVHGGVILRDPEKNTALSKRRSWEGFELETLLGWMNTTRAENWEQWIEQASRSALNINMYYADKQGNIGYAFTGKYPDRQEGHDNRLPVPGDGSMDWNGFLPFENNPKVYNPEQGFIINWNNRPAYGGVLNPDMFWYSWSKADRVEVLMDYVKARAKLEPEELWNLIEHSSFHDVNARYFCRSSLKPEPSQRMNGLKRQRRLCGNGVFKAGMTIRMENMTNWALPFFEHFSPT